ncbi:hypothetical protein QBC39DRAFT_358745 [Podospora conica]|nr:hypothetical protein QBC39DRAFT_358745 [Schizothecium conicum]
MESWEAHTSPNLKFEDSPAESFLSTPDERYPPLFGHGSMAAMSAADLDSLNMMSPQSLNDRCSPDLDVLALARSSVTPCPTTPGCGTPGADESSEKKPAKKRKSWGQVLPEPKTNLPPRKRAKTEDEKEQRRVERVLRNRRAAQSSRERKRLEVEELEKRNKQLMELLTQARQQNEALKGELQKVLTTGAITMTSPSFEALRPSPPVTLSQELFSSQDGHITANEAGSFQQLELLTDLPNSTVNPASLSPTLTPVPEADEEYEKPATTVDAATIPKVTSADATQHPAAMLCSDLPCRSAEAPPSEWLAKSQPPHPALTLMTLQTFLISTWTTLSLCQRPLTQIALSLKARFSLPPTPAILNTIILLVTNPSPLTTSSPTTKSSTPSSNCHSTQPLAASSTTRRSSSLRVKFLRKILTCSPSLARPLRDATMAALRLVSTEGDKTNWDGGDASRTAAVKGKGLRPQHDGGSADWLNGLQAPSKEVLLTLLWVLQIEERRLEIRNEVGTSSQPERPFALSVTPATEEFVLKVSLKRRLGGKAQGVPDFASLKRRRV